MTHREKVQDMAKEKGHCLCSKLFTCPCKWFNDMGTCKCAMEGNVSIEDWLEYNTKKDEN